MRNFAHLATFLILACIFFPACGELQGSKDLTNENNTTDRAATQLKTIPDPSPVSGQIIIRMANQIDPSNLEGYVVGRQNILRLQAALGGEFFIDNVPPGNQDIILRSKTETANVNESESKVRYHHGLRVSNIEVVAGQRTRLDGLELAELVDVSGNAKLLGETSHEGISVLILGTDYQVKTDADGSFKFVSLPAGIHTFIFDRSGYFRSQLQAGSGAKGSLANLLDVKLSPDNGSDGIMILGDGSEEYHSRTVPIIVGANKDLTVMKISEDINFTGKKWLPINSVASYTFDTEGKKTLFLRFANANGLETSPIVASISVRLFPLTIPIASANGETLMKQRSVTFLVLPAFEWAMSDLSPFGVIRTGFK